ncbi:Uncharacterised protein [Mycobacteroides abscessus subsp. massiliense]|nr:Uncharacterised protein [Mycobacteroides abscessus subsp. massiliense]
MMQHGEAHHGAEPVVVERQLGAVALHHGRPVAIESLEPGGHGLVDLDRGELRGAIGQHPKVRAIAGPDLQSVRTEFNPLQRPGEELRLGLACPHFRATAPPMHQIHCHNARLGGLRARGYRDSANPYRASDSDTRGQSVGRNTMGACVLPVDGFCTSTWTPSSLRSSS